MRLSQLNQVEYDDILLIVKYLRIVAAPFLHKKPALLDIARRFLPNTRMSEQRTFR